MAGTRLTRGLAAMLASANGGALGDVIGWVDDTEPWGMDRHAGSMLATPTGQALAALVEAAVEWRHKTPEYRLPSDFALADAVIAWLAATEETPDAR